tara:strand:- start:217 stop:1188 length:972 start_codon:yes stop_codon:yes gene_type:complete
MATIGQIESRLRGLGYNNLRSISAKRVAILTNGDRTSILQSVAQELSEEFGAVYNPSPTTSSGSLISSVGAIDLNGNKMILARPANRQGGNSAGLSNEAALVNNIQHHLNDWGTLTVIFTGAGKRVKVEGVNGVRSVGGSTADRSKSDVELTTTTGQSFPISIKKNNAEYWESADRLWGETAGRVLDFLVEKGDITINRSGNVSQFGPGTTGVSLPCSNAEKTDFVFGNDILGNGIIVKQTFNPANFKWSEDTGTLTVSCSKVFKTLNDITSSSENPHILIRKDRTRSSIPGYPGMRVLCTYQSRANSGSVRRFSRQYLRSVL